MRHPGEASKKPTVTSMTTEAFHLNAMDPMRIAVCQPLHSAEAVTTLKHLLIPWQGQLQDHLVMDQQIGGLDKERVCVIFFLS